MVQIAASPITLDPSDPFDAALIPHRRDEPPKRAEYAKDGDRSTTSDVVAASRAVKGSVQRHTKLARLKSPRQNGRIDDPQNEAMLDTHLHLATYGVLLYALAREASMPEIISWQVFLQDDQDRQRRADERPWR